MSAKTITEILGDFSTNRAGKKQNLKAVTLWVPDETKEKYDRLQKSSNRSLSKKAREMFVELIAAAELLAP